MLYLFVRHRKWYIYSVMGSFLGKIKQYDVMNGVSIQEELGLIFQGY